MRLQINLNNGGHLLHHLLTNWPAILDTLPASHTQPPNPCKLLGHCEVRSDDEEMEWIPRVLGLTLYNSTTLSPYLQATFSQSQDGPLQAELRVFCLVA